MYRVNREGEDWRMGMSAGGGEGEQPVVGEFTDEFVENGVKAENVTRRI